MTTAAQGLTRADLESLRETTDDGRRYELMDGVIVVTPSPSRRHQVVVTGLLRQLFAADRARYRVLASGDETVGVTHPAPMTLHPASWLE